MAVSLLLIVHAVMVVFVTIELGLMADVVDFTITPFGHWTPSSYSFMLFNSVWSLVVLAYLAIFPVYLSKLYHSVLALAAIIVTSLFWFAGSIAMAVRFGVPVCGSDSVCATTQAAVAFGFFDWVLFSALATMEGIASVRGGGAQVDTVQPPTAMSSV